MFKGKKRKASEVASARKGKVKMKLQFTDEEKEVYISKTKAILPYNNREYELVLVYGIGKDNRMMLLTNRKLETIKDLIRAKKQEYDFENMRVRTLKAMNNLNLMLKRKVYLWLNQISRGIEEILKYARKGIKEYQKIEKRAKVKQLELKL